MTQDELKQAVAQAAADYVAKHAPEGSIIGVGTGSTANFFIDALAAIKGRYKGAVASSEATRKRLEGHGIAVFDLNDVDDIPVYVDGADEIDPALRMIKGGGGALTREKIVASAFERFVCIVDASKEVATLGRYPLPIEVIPMARELVAARARALGGQPRLREGFTTDNGQQILDVSGLRIEDPVGLEREINQWPGVVTVGIFARHRASVCLLGTPKGVKTLGF